MDIALPFAACLLSGAIAGIYLSVVIHDFRIKDLEASAYVAMHQMRDKTYRVVMPILGFTTLTILFAVAAMRWGRSSSVPFAVAAVLCAIDIIIAIQHQVPLNRQVQSWDAALPPSGWPVARDRWERGHRFRTLLALLFFAYCLTGLIISAR